MGQTSAVLEAMRTARPGGRDALVAAATAAAEGLPAGERFPTVRAVAAATGLGRTTVEAAWRQLERDGVVVTRGRGGTTVAGRGATPSARYQRLAGAPLAGAMDLASGTPDPDLLPAPGPYLTEVGRRPAAVSSYQGPPVVPELEQAIRRALDGVVPGSAAITIVDGALDAVDRLLGQLVRPGRLVAVEDPGFPPLFDLVEAHGGRCVPLDVDDEGVVSASIDAAAERGAVVAILQPRAGNPTGGAVTPARARALAKVLRRHGHVVVIEDDHTGDVSSAPPVSLATAAPGRVVHVRSASKSHGPDLRLAAVLGPHSILDALETRRRLGPSWSSRLLQAVWAAMLTDSSCRRTVAAAATAYAKRRAETARLLGEAGLATSGVDGLNLWAGVPDEDDALVTFAAAGFAVAPGAPFRLRSGDGSGPHVRVTTALLRTPADRRRFAEAAADVAARGSRRSSVR